VEKTPESHMSLPHMEKPEIVHEAIWQWLEEKMRFER